MSRKRLGLDKLTEASSSSFISKYASQSSSSDQDVHNPQACPDPAGHTGGPGGPGWGLHGQAVQHGGTLGPPGGQSLKALTGLCQETLCTLYG